MLLRKSIIFLPLSSGTSLGMDLVYGLSCLQQQGDYLFPQYALLPALSMHRPLNISEHMKRILIQTSKLFTEVTLHYLPKNTKMKERMLVNFVLQLSLTNRGRTLYTPSKGAISRKSRLPSTAYAVRGSEVVGVLVTAFGTNQQTINYTNFFWPPL
ncbi:hypothetical protein DL96DRAFT_1684285 [Flagelloscypha sp. PMI_526]|nr:hypothetical protein DL96DRAFT_1684285 [Flagelloscypha sp. PMI_526]